MYLNQNSNRLNSFNALLKKTPAGVFFDENE